MKLGEAMYKGSQGEGGPDMDMGADDDAPRSQEDDGVVDAVMVEQTNHIADQLGHCIGLDTFRLIAPPVTSLVRRNYLITSLGKGRDLVPPGISDLREAVQQDNSWAITITANSQ